ncbi:hypothetical protein VMT65_31180 [Nocardia sp. CDC153]|uniref:hypothetical protein n=1 Tax=Nocardia sp. CDC153 TaxID=3112167 RepID=UPI002DBDC5D2|nr:hypothetical protein [Nocardia sp. CDC153]MEC3957533.1 hypothetical protein [Nocardia sp. CDC153]
MTGISYDRVIDALRQITTEANTQSGEWTKFSCPVPSHGKGRGDRNPSLGVKYDPRREKTIITCFSGCQQDDVLSAANLRVRDLFDHLPDRTQNPQRPERRQPQRPSVPTNSARRQEPSSRTDHLGAPTGPRRRVATYTYTTAANEPVGQVIRYAVPYEHGTEKTFSQRRWDPQQRQWVPGGFAPMLYQAPIVAWAIREGHPILACEGEKDVDRAIAAGYPATCNAGGAQKFRAEHAEQLRGATRLVIVADRDAPGFRHAAQVFDHARRIVPQIDVVAAAHGKDLSDHLDAGRSINDLCAVSPDQLDPFRSTPHDRGPGPERPRTGAVPTPRRSGLGHPDLDWGLER